MALIGGSKDLSTFNKWWSRFHTNFGLEQAVLLEMDLETMA